MTTTTEPDRAASPSGLPAAGPVPAATPRPVRVLTLLHDLGFGGDEIRTLSFARTVDPQRVRHTLVTINRPGVRAEPEVREHYAAAGLSVLDLGSGDNAPPAPSSGGPVASARRTWALLRRLRKGAVLVRRLRALVLELDIDVIDAHNEVPAVLAVVVGRLTGRPVAVTSYHLESRADSRVMWLAGQVSWGGADALISDSHFAVDLMRRWTLRQPRRMEVVRNGVVSPRTAVSPDEARRRLGLPPSGVVVGQISRLHPLKGHRYVVEAMPRVLAAHPDTHFLFVGFPETPDVPDELRRRARELGVEAHLTIRSHAGDIGEVWPAVDVHVHASLLESLPIAIAEGMSLGKPAVVTAIAGTEEEVTDGITGLVVPPQDASALAAAVIRLLDDPALGARLGAAAQQRYLEMFQPEAMARHLEQIFGEMARHAGRS